LKISRDKQFSLSIHPICLLTAVRTARWNLTRRNDFHSLILVRSKTHRKKVLQLMWPRLYRQITLAIADWIAIDYYKIEHFLKFVLD